MVEAGPDTFVSIASSKQGMTRQNSRCNKGRLLIWIGFAVACLEKCINGSVFIFSVYSVAMKETFNYTQKEVELIASALNVGQGLAIIPGLFFDRFGPRLTVVIGLFVTSGSYLLIWSSTRMVHFYRTKSYLFAMYFFLGGFGSMFPHIASINTNVVNFGEDWSGRVIGIQDAFYGGSPIILSVLYYSLFSSGDGANHRDREDFPGFMLFLAIAYACAHFLCLIFLKMRTRDRSTDKCNKVAKPTPTEHVYQNGVFTVTDEKSNNNITETQTPETSPNPDTPDHPHISFLQLFKKKHFHFYVWIFSIVAAVEVTFMNNITISSKALGLTPYDKITVPLSMASCFVTSIACGFLVDSFRHNRQYFALVGSVISSLSLTLATTVASEYAFFLTSSMLITSSACCFWTLVPTEINDVYGSKQFGRNFGCIIFSHAMLGIALQYLFGWFYDTGIDDEQDIHCYGIHCVRSGYSLLLSFSVVCLIVCVLVVFVKKRRSKTVQITGS